MKKAMIMHLFHRNFPNLCQKWLLKINIAKPNFRTLFIYQKCSQFDGRYKYIQRYLRAKLGAYRTVCGISGVHNGEAAEFPIHTSLIHGRVHIRVHHSLAIVGFLSLAFRLKHFKTKCTFLEYLKHVISSTRMFHLTSKLQRTVSK